MPRISSKPPRRRDRRGPSGSTRDATPAELRLREQSRFVGAVYEVTVDSGDLVEFEPLVMSASPRSSARCHETLFNATRPCTGCPALAPRRPGGRTDPALLFAPGGNYRLALAEPLGNGRFRMHVLQLSDSALTALARARIDRRVQRADLSKRELTVLELLLLGRTSLDIAGSLGITERTTRFHVANVLAKLGVESRTELFRLLL